MPRVHGFDADGREVLDFMPGHVVDVDTELLSYAQVGAVARWTRGFHEAVRGFEHPGPWRYFPVDRPTLVGHNDIAPYNVCFDGDVLVGVFDWDLSGPTTALHELAFIAWNCVPLWRDVGADESARRLVAIADGYGGLAAREVLDAVPARITRMLDGIPAAAAAGDDGMRRLMTVGEPERSRVSLAALAERMPEIRRRIPS